MLNAAKNILARGINLLQADSASGSLVLAEMLKGESSQLRVPLDIKRTVSASI
ncbi:MAG: hypothetical protein JNN15_08885 [Blastocatellia bacterium]|nr:hypothetical protein [Blastocatellia bacterium]